jgi:hypothetical protein
MTGEQGSAQWNVAEWHGEDLADLSWALGPQAHLGRLRPGDQRSRQGCGRAIGHKVLGSFAHAARTPDWY